MSARTIATQSLILFNRKVSLVFFLVKLYVFPLLVLYALYRLLSGQFTATDMWLFAVFYFLTVMGITLGFHRLETHGSFKAHPIVRFVLLVFGTMAAQGPVTYWIAVHLRHHACADKEGDPHSPVALGLGYGHWKWQLKTNWEALRNHYKRRFEGDRLLEFFDRSALLWIFLGGLIPYLIGGWSGVLWGFVVRTFANNHVIWGVNSWGHSHGSRDFATKDNSRNNFWLAILSLGDGWHNNHHAYPKSACHGFKWQQVDVNGYVIRLLERLGLVTEVCPVPEQKQLVSQRCSTSR